jgi:hypothetical protein
MGQGTSDDMDILARLHGEHRLIERLAARLALMVQAPEPPEGLGFLRFRREFGRTLGLHLKHEDWLVYPALRSHARPEVRELAQDFCVASAALSTEFQVYGRVWTSLTIAGDWPGFQAATASLLQGLRGRIAMEEQELYPLLARGGEAALPKAPPFAVPARIARHQTMDRAQGMASRAR